jgi:hypothetical protein
MPPLPPNHFLSVSQPPPFAFPSGPLAASSTTPLAPTNDHALASTGPSFDTSTLAAHDFDVDARTGFMPPQPPLARLPDMWTEWENALEDACKRKLELGTKSSLTIEQAEESSEWRKRIRQVRFTSSFLLIMNYNTDQTSRCPLSVPWNFEENALFAEPTTF